LTVASDANERLVLALARERMHGRPAHVLASRLGLHPSMLSHWAYRRKAPSEQQAVHLAELLGEPPEALFPELFTPHDDHDPADEGRAAGKAGDDSAHHRG
jgi:transcriptional regulator with XRE-family HTH domain